jgi:hypothetical protein
MIEALAKDTEQFRGKVVIIRCVCACWHWGGVLISAEAGTGCVQPCGSRLADTRAWIARCYRCCCCCFCCLLTLPLKTHVTICVSGTRAPRVAQACQRCSHPPAPSWAQAWAR